MKATLTYLSALVILVITITGCTKERRERTCETEPEVQCAVDSNMVNVRIRNISSYPICDMVMFHNLSDSLLFGFIGAGDTTCYIPVDWSIESPGFRYKMGVEDGFLLVGSNGLSRFDQGKTFVTYNLTIDRAIDTIQSSGDLIIYEYFPSSNAAAITYP